jgi:hypothetical protein
MRPSSTMRRSLRAPFAPFAFIAAAILAFASGCTPKESGRCFVEGDLRCDGAAKALVCTDKSWKSVDCLGAAGCTATPTPICDESVGKSGGSCWFSNGNGVACETATNAVLACTSGKWAQSKSCGGKRGCTVTAAVGGVSDLSCDDSVAAVGETCDSEAIACSKDGTQLLVCKSGTFAVKTACGGDKHCTVEGDAARRLARCDGSKGSVGAACEAGAFACSIDGSRVLTCKDGLLAEQAVCATGHTCHVDADGADASKIGCR